MSNHQIYTTRHFTLRKILRILNKIVHVIIYYYRRHSRLINIQPYMALIYKQIQSLENNNLVILKFIWNTPV